MLCIAAGWLWVLWVLPQTVLLAIHGNRTSAANKCSVSSNGLNAGKIFVISVVFPSHPAFTFIHALLFIWIVLGNLEGVWKFWKFGSGGSAALSTEHQFSFFYSVKRLPGISLWPRGALRWAAVPQQHHSLGMLLLEKYSGEYLRLNFHGHVRDVLLCTASSAVSLGRNFPFKASVEKICASVCPLVQRLQIHYSNRSKTLWKVRFRGRNLAWICGFTMFFFSTFSIGTFVSAFTVLCGARTDLPDRHICCVFWLNIAAALIQILTAIVMVGWIMSIFWGMDMVILASKYSAISIPSSLCC